MAARHGRCIADTSRNLTAFICAASVAFSTSDGRTECRTPQSSSNVTLLASNLYCFGLKFRWSGHVSRMSDERIPKRMLYGQLPNAKRHPGGQRKRYKDKLRVNLKTCNIDYTKLEAVAADRSQWRRLCYSAVEQFEQQRIDTAKTRRATRKAHTFTNSSTSTSYICDTCGYVCSSRIGLFGHNRRLSPLSITIMCVVTE